MRNRCRCHILLFGVIVIFSSCLMKREHMYHFTKSDSLCFNAYDTLNCYVLKTNKGKDTLRFVRKCIEENYNEWYFDMNDGAVFNAHFYCDGILTHNGHNEEISISYTKESDNHDPVMSIVLAERYALSIKDERNYVNGFYKDTIIVDSENSQQNSCHPHSFTFEYLKWHKYKGIVEYKLSDGTIYKDSLK